MGFAHGSTRSPIGQERLSELTPDMERLAQEIAAAEEVQSELMQQMKQNKAMATVGRFGEDLRVTSITKALSGCFTNSILWYTVTSITKGVLRVLLYGSFM